MELNSLRNSRLMESILVKKTEDVPMALKRQFARYFNVEEPPLSLRSKTVHNRLLPYPPFSSASMIYAVGCSRDVLWLHDGTLIEYVFDEFWTELDLLTCDTSKCDHWVISVLQSQCSNISIIDCVRVHLLYVSR